MHPKTGIIGLGLIGGSLALSLREKEFSNAITGYDVNPFHATQALELGLIDKLQTIDEICNNCEFIILAIPVNQARKLLPELLNKISDKTIITDMGSTKNGICKAVENHKNRKQFVATHPIAGTENTGPSAAVRDLFKNKITIICEKEKSGKSSLQAVKKMYDSLEMKTIYMQPDEHDLHVAYVSHLSHISSFMLGNTVLEIEKNEKNIFNLAGSGFASTVRLAKSSPEMWAPIFEQNSSHLLNALDEYIEQLKNFRQLIQKKDIENMKKEMARANRIRKILEGI
jgi:prephenate dehydrogenase